MKIVLVETEWGGVGWISLVRDRNKCRALLNAVTNLRIP
jgi:hypothetical protein